MKVVCILLRSSSWDEIECFSFLPVIHVFDLMPGASRQNEVTTCHTKTTVQQIAVSRAGTIDDQYMVFIDTNRDIFCASLKNGSNFEIYKIGMNVFH